MFSALLLFAVCGSFGWSVLVPFHDNIQLLAAEERFQRNHMHPELRQWMDRNATKSWDPYLEGRKDLLIARICRKLGRSEEAVLSYHRALEGRHDPRVILELGLYEWELGRPEVAEEHLARAVRFSQVFLYEIPELSMRQRVQKRALEVSSK